MQKMLFEIAPGSSVLDWVVVAAVAAAVSVVVVVVVVVLATAAAVVVVVFGVKGLLVRGEV